MIINGMTIQQLNQRAIELNAEVIAIRKALVEATVTNEEFRQRVHSVDSTAIRKLRMFPGDFTVSKIVTLTTKLLKNQG